MEAFEVGINDVLWITSTRGTLGIVRGKDDITGHVTYYVSAVEGEDLLTDLDYILKWGAKIDPMMIFEFIKQDVIFNAEKTVVNIKDRMKSIYEPHKL